MVNEIRWWGRWRSRRGTISASVAGATQPTVARSVDVELIIRAARLAVTTRAASRAAFVRHLDVTDDVADLLLWKLEHCEVIAGDEPGRSRRILTTSGELPGVVAEFRRRA